MTAFLIDALWQIPLLALVAALASRFLRNSPAQYRHVVWVAALVLAASLPWYQPARTTPSVPDLPTLQAARLPIAIPLPDAVAVLPSVARTVAYSRPAADLITRAYLLFLLLALCRFAWQWRRALHLRRTAACPPLPPLLESIRQRCAAALGAAEVELLASDRVSGPVTAGRTVILPPPLFAETSADLLTAAIGHEVAHVVRRDYAWNLFYEFVTLPVSFHPAAWYLSRGVKASREMACDELVSRRRLLEPVVYARSLVTIASAMVRRPASGWALGATDGSILEQRIRQILENRKMHPKIARSLLLAGLLGLAACSFLAINLSFAAPPPLPPPAAPVAAIPPAAIEQTPVTTPPVNDFLSMGIAAYNGNDFPHAVAHFTNATNFDPSDLRAHIFLALSDVRAYFAGSKSPELLEDAVRQYQYVLARDSQNVAALAGMTAVALNAGHLPEARQWALRFFEVAPQDARAPFLAALADFSIAGKPIQEARKKWNVRPAFVRHGHIDPAKPETLWIPDAETRKTLQDQLLPTVEEGLRMAKMAVERFPTAVGAMGYVTNHLLLKAAIADDLAQAAELARQAEEWSNKMDALLQVPFAPVSPLMHVFDPLSLTGPLPDPLPSVKP